MGYCRAAGLAGASATPVPPRLHLKLGIALQAQGRLEEAISNFTAATAGSYGLVADGDDEGGVASEAHHHAGLSLKRLGRLAEAVSCCLLACNGSPCLIRHCGHGASTVESGGGRQAGLAQLLRRDPGGGDLRTRHGLGRWLLQQVRAAAEQVGRLLGPLLLPDPPR